MLDSLSQKVPHIAGPREEVEENQGDPSWGGVHPGGRNTVLSISSLTKTVMRQLIFIDNNWAIG